MARATTKTEWIRASDENFRKLFSLIQSMTLEQRERTFAFDDRDKNIRDVLMHLYEWHQLLLKWIRSNQAAIPAGFLPEPYNWKTYPQMNIGFWEKNQGVTLNEAERLLKESHSEVMALVDTFSDEQLFTKKFFPWTGSTNLGSYCISSTSSHYDWAVKKIKKHKGSCG